MGCGDKTPRFFFVRRICVGVCVCVSVCVRHFAAAKSALCCTAISSVCQLLSVDKENDLPLRIFLGQQTHGKYTNEWEWRWTDGLLCEAFNWSKWEIYQGSWSWPNKSACKLGKFVSWRDFTMMVEKNDYVRGCGYKKVYFSGSGKVAFHCGEKNIKWSNILLVARCFVF